MKYLLWDVTGAGNTAGSKTILVLTDELRVYAPANSVLNIVMK